MMEMRVALRIVFPLRTCDLGDILSHFSYRKFTARLLLRHLEYQYLHGLA
jgi:hypothetical protein